MTDRKFIVLILLVFATLFLNGCWDRRETEEILLIDALALDKVIKEGEEQFRIAFVSTKGAQATGQMGMGQGGGQQQAQQITQQWVASSTGSTLEEAADRFSIRSPRYMNLDHNNLVILGEELARDGVSEILDFMVRKRELRLRNFIIITRGNALNSLESAPEYEENLARELLMILERGSREGDYFHFYDLNHFARDVVTVGQDPWAPLFTTFKPAEPNTPPRSVLIQETALFKKDKLVGFLNQNETEGFLLLKGFAARGGFYPDIKGERFSFLYEDPEVKRKLTFENGQINIGYDIEMEGRIQEIRFYTNFTEDEVREMEQKLSRLAEEHAKKAANKCQQLGSDALGIGRFIHAKHPEVWNQYRGDWYQVYPDINVDVKVKVEITGSNLGYKPIIPERNE